MSASAPITGGEAPPSAQVDTALAVQTSNNFLESWENFLNVQAKLLETISSEVEWDENSENNSVQPPTDSNQQIPQIRKLIQSLKDAQRRRLLELGLDDNEYPIQMSFDSLKSEDSNRKSLLVPRSQAQHDETLDTLDVMRHQAEALYVTRRGRINFQSRGISRPIDIRDVPDEILAQIAYFMCIRSRNLFVKEQIGVHNFRLTCWRFCNVGSPFLLSTLHVEMSLKSLARLTEVSRHPTILKGVRKLIINLCFYDSIMANDLEYFVLFQSETLAQWLISMQRALEIANEAPDDELPIFPIPSIVAAMNETETMAKAWEGFTISNLQGGVPLDDFIVPALKAHEAYQARYGEQEKLREGSFSQEIARALARMPSATQLQVVDYQTSRRRNMEPWDFVFDSEALVEILASPVNCEEAKRHRLGLPPLEQLFKIPIACHKEGVRLTSFDITISSPANLESIGPNASEMRDLKASMQHLEIFYFNLDPLKMSLSRRHIEEYLPLSEFLSAILDTPSVKNIRICLSDLRDMSMAMPLEDFSFLRFIGHQSIRKWRDIQSINLHSIPITVEDLEELAERVLHPGVDLSIIKMDLMTGSWVDALDILRAKCGTHTMLLEPFGAEIEAVPHDRTDAIFMSPSSMTMSLTPAMAYLRGYTTVNPMRQLLEDLDSAPEDEGDGFQVADDGTATEGN